MISFVSRSFYWIEPAWIATYCERRWRRSRRILFEGGCCGGCGCNTGFHPVFFMLEISYNWGLNECERVCAAALAYWFFNANLMMMMKTNCNAISSLHDLITFRRIIIIISIFSLLLFDWAYYASSRECVGGPNAWNLIKLLASILISLSLSLYLFFFFLFSCSSCNFILNLIKKSIRK